jgi:hypothetical protein
LGWVAGRIILKETNKMSREIRTINCKACNNPVELLSSWANQCDNCGAEYNGSGQRLAPREQWGEETGEDWVGLSNFDPDAANLEEVFNG